ncbi:MAG: tetratricopeptide repeat protein [Sedimentisphaerales bacterium]|jgi:tetratricopeptide (TPR) repeat protein
MSSKTVLLAVLITCVCAAVIAVHWPALSAQALSFDDDQYLVNNALVKNPSCFSAWKFLSQVLEPSTVKGYYQPLAMISLMFDYSLGGRVENLLPFHRTSLALHAANTALVIVLLYLLFGEVWIAAAAGLLFGLHPMTVETISWVGERKTLLAAFFAFWSLIFYLRYTHARTVIPAKNVTSAKAGAKIQSPVDRSACGFYIACLFFYLLALMSKPTSTPLPVLMLLLDFWPLKRLKWQSFIEKIPFFILGGIFAIITYISQTSTGGSTLPTETGIWRISLILCHNIIFYLYKIIWPINLSSHYPFPDPMNIFQPMVLAGVIGTCILIPLLLIYLRWTRAAFTGWLFFFVAILPTMQIIGFSNVIASDKFAYIPSFGLLMVLTSFLCSFAKNRCNLSNLRLKSASSVAVILFVLILASAESLATRSYLIHWRNSVGLLKYMLSKASNDPLLHYNLGCAYFEIGHYEDSIEAYKQAIKIKPDLAEAHYNLGVACGKLGRYQDAIEAYKQAIRIKPDYAEAYYNLGNAYSELGRYQEAINEYKQAIKNKPDYAEAHYNLGNACNRLGRSQDAVEAYKQAIKNKPDYAEAHYNLGNACNRLGRSQDAVDAYKQAIKNKPDYAEAHYNLGVTYVAAGDKNLALEEYKILKNLDAEKANELSKLIK